MIAFARSARRWLLSAAVLIVAGCGESEPADIDTGNPTDNGGSTGPGAGTVVLQVPVTGPLLDTDGFDLKLDGATWRRVATSTLRFGLTEGRHTLALDGLAPGCESSAGTIEVQVVRGGVHEVALPVRCRGGVLRWRAEAMRGQDLDLDGNGYTLEMLRDGALVRADVLIADSVGFALLGEGSFELRLGQLASNCSGRFTPGPAATIADGDTLEVTIQVTCQPIPLGGIVFSDGRDIYRLYEPWGEPVFIQMSGSAPRWSLDLRHIAFVRNARFQVFDDYYGIVPVPGPMIMAANGSGTASFGPTWAFAPRFLDDGRLWLGPGRSLWGEYDDAVVSADGTTLGRLGWTVPEGTVVLDASRDGSVLAVLSYGGAGRRPRGVYVVRSDGTPLWQATAVAEDEWDVSAVLSPDGARVAVRLSFSTVVVADGTGGRAMPALSGTMPLVWAPDGARLLVSRPLLDVASLEIVRASDGAVLETVWRGGARQVTADWR